jgi:hypothetical protein
LDFHGPSSDRHVVFIILKGELIAMNKSLASAGLKLLAEEWNDKARFHSGWMLLIMKECPSTISSIKLRIITFECNITGCQQQRKERLPAQGDSCNE